MELAARLLGAGYCLALLFFGFRWCTGADLTSNDGPDGHGNKFIERRRSEQIPAMKNPSPPPPRKGLIEGDCKKTCRLNDDAGQMKRCPPPPPAGRIIKEGCQPENPKKSLAAYRRELDDWYNQENQIGRSTRGGGNYHGPLNN